MGSAAAKEGATVGELGPTITSRVASEIGSRIIDGAYRPGMSLREIPLSEELGVSRGSIREALRILERDGVVRIEPRKGASVTELSTDELIEIYQVRSALLGLAAALACERMDERDHRWLGRKLEDMKAAGEAPEARAAALHAGISSEMAAYLIERAANRRLQHLLTQLAPQIARYTRIGVSTAERRTESVGTWDALLQAMARRDAAAADQLGRKLVRDTLRFALARIAGLA
ncbi:MAG TPA: GntR family transcriptional regulator [Ramlibacter sp.]|nr:GntR family transcriptional regulator [Ramlibacter sp.]